MNREEVTDLESDAYEQELLANLIDESDVDPTVEDIVIPIMLPPEVEADLIAKGVPQGQSGVRELQEETEKALAGHLAIYDDGSDLIADVYEGETAVTDEEIELFLNMTEDGNKQSLIPENSIAITGPTLVLKRISVEEVAFYKRHNLLYDINDPREGLWNLICDLGSETVLLGKVENTLKTYLMLKQLYPKRQVYCRAPEEGIEDTLIEPEDLSFMLLEDLSFYEGVDDGE